MDTKNIGLRNIEVADTRISFIDGDPKKLAEIQQIDMNTQLDGVWLYDICTSIEQASKKPDIKISKFKKNT